MEVQRKKKGTKDRKYDIQDRFISYAVTIIHAFEKLPNTKVGQHVAFQMLRSGTSQAANYGETQGAEYRNETAKKKHD